MEFDHKLIKTWDDVAKYRPKVEPYLTRDVDALKELFETFNDQIYDIFEANITSYLSTGHMAYAIWSSTLENIIELPDLEKYQFIKKATYGARCYPQKKHFSSNTFSTLRKEGYKGKELYQKLYDSNDFIFNADASSLYPASMRGFELLDVQYPTKFSRWSAEPEKEYESGKVGFYEIKYTPPTNIRVPILIR